MTPLLAARGWGNIAGAGGPRPADEQTSTFLQNISAFMTENLFSTWALIGLVLLVFAAVGGVWGYRRWQMRDLHAPHMLIFREIASEFGLRLRDQWLMYRVASRGSLPSPLTLFMSADTYQHHVARFIATVSEARRNRVREQLAQIRKQLYGAQTPRNEGRRPAAPRRAA